MGIKVSNVKFYQKTSKGHFLSSDIGSTNLSQLESDIQNFLNKNGLTAQSKVGKSSLTITNIKSIKTGKRAPPWVYARIRQMIASGLEARNMRGSVTGST